MTSADRIVRLREVAERLGYKPSYLQRVVSDAARPPGERRLPQDVHKQFPPMRKGGIYGARWGIYGPTFTNWLNRRLNHGVRSMAA